MDCNEVRELLNDYVNDELDDEQKDHVKEHLQNCPNCRKERENVVSLDNILKSFAKERVEPSLNFFNRISQQLKSSFKVFFDLIYPEEPRVLQMITIFDGRNPRKRYTPSYKEWYDKFEKDMLKKAYKLTLNEEEAWDLYKDAYDQALKNEKSYNPKRPFEGWFYTIMRNLWYKKVKEEAKKEIPYDSLETYYGGAGMDVPHPVDLLEKVDREELNAIIQEAIEKLEPDCRYAIISIYFEDKTYAEAAEELEIDEDDFKSLIRRAKRALEKKLKDKIDKL
ncbi:MAG: sigma-70 family RNA polymerase sigma factor [Abditibacteriota bacterium]|nr:sigma-70 family RNA polymerase sigma factor [Abditibacteriota bacterium]